MASADVRQELDCSICLNIYTDPVNLRCGHNFCRDCIDRVLDTQEGSGGYSCPQCREKFQDRPVLQKNITLHKIVTIFQPIKLDQKTLIPCKVNKIKLTKQRIQSLQDRKRKVQEQIAGVREKVTALVRHLGIQMEDLENKVLSEISSKETCLLLSLSNCIHDLEIKEELLKKIHHNVESDTGDLCDTEEGDDEDRERHDRLLHDGGDLDVSGISHTLHTGLSDMIKEVNVFFYIQEASDILLDVNTAQNKLQISDDMKTVSRSDIEQNRPETPERFQKYCQVLSNSSFSLGRHYWEVDASESDFWMVGMCYPSIEKRGDQSGIGYNDKSWGIFRQNDQFAHIHNKKRIWFHDNISKIRIYLDYEAGQLSFYDLCDPIRHLHTFTTTFTEPLHAVIGVEKGCVRISGEHSQ